MSRFWYSRRNYNRAVGNIKTLFTAVGEDMDSCKQAITALTSRVTALENSTVYTNCQVVRDSEGV